MAVASEVIAPERRESGRAAARAGFDAWWTLTLTFLLSMIAYLDRQIVSMIVPDIKASLAISDFQVGLILGPAFAVFFSIFAVPMGWASDRFSRRLVIFVGVALFGVATALSGLATTFAALLIARTCVAIGEAGLGPAALSLLSEKFPRHLMTTAVSIYSAGLKVGGAAAFALGAVVIVWAGRVVHATPQLTAVEPWRLVFTITGAPAIVLGLLVFTFRESPRSARQAAVGAEGHTAIHFLISEQRLFIPLLIGGSLVAMCGQALIGWTPTFIVRHFGWKPAQYGPVLAAIALASSALLVAKGALQDWLYVRGIKDVHIRFYTWLLIGSLPMVATAFLVKDVSLFLFLYGTIAIITVPYLSYINVAVQMITPRQLRGRLAALVAVPMTLLGGIGAMVVGALTDFVFHDESKLGYSMAILFCVAIPGALVSFRLCLKPLREAILAAEERDKGERRFAGGA